MESYDIYSGATVNEQEEQKTSTPKTNVNSGEKNSDLNVIKIKELVKKGYEKIEETKACKKSVIIVGKTGVGKSTLVNGLVGNKLKIAAKPKIEIEEAKNEDSDDSGKGEKEVDYFLETGASSDCSSQIAKIGHTNKSETTVPGSFEDSKTGVMYYDCPGFGDTKSIQQEIINSLYIKRILDRSEEVKLLYVVDYASTIVSRSVELINILKTISYFDPEEIKNSIGIIVSKAPAEYSRGKLVNSFKGLAKDLGGQENSEACLLSNELITFAESIKKSMIGVTCKPAASGEYALDESLVKLVNETLNFVNLKTRPLIISAESREAVRGYRESAAEQIKVILAEFSSEITQKMEKLKDDRIAAYKYVCEKESVIWSINDAKVKDGLDKPSLLEKVHPDLPDILDCIKYTKEIIGSNMSVSDLLNFREIAGELSQRKQSI